MGSHADWRLQPHQQFNLSIELHCVHGQSPGHSAMTSSHHSQNANSIRKLPIGENGHIHSRHQLRAEDVFTALFQPFHADAEFLKTFDEEISVCVHLGFVERGF